MNDVGRFLQAVPAKYRIVFVFPDISRAFKILQTVSALSVGRPNTGNGAFLPAKFVEESSDVSYNGKERTVSSRFHSK